MDPIPDNSKRFWLVFFENTQNYDSSMHLIYINSYRNPESHWKPSPKPGTTARTHAHMSLLTIR